MNVTEDRRIAPLLDRDRHAEALTTVTAQVFAAGRVTDALHYADRRCRLSEKPGPHDHLMRALTVRAAGIDPSWIEDLEKAVRTDPTSRLINLARLRLSTDATDRREAARRLLEAPTSDLSTLRVAAKTLFAAGEAAVAALETIDDRLFGRILAPSGRTLDLELRDDTGTRRLALTPEAGTGFEDEIALVRLHEVPVSGIVFHRLFDGDTVLAEGRVWGRSSRPASPRTPISGARPPWAEPIAEVEVAVVLPIYDDFEATSACLASVVAERERRGRIRIVCIDDASPDPRISAALDDLAANGAIELLRNTTNLGFIGAVERGLSTIGEEDVLLLNADTVLPAGAIDRLVGAVRCAPDIGTATPFSNNGEYLSFPRPMEEHAAPSPAMAARIDAAAAVVNAGVVVDIPNGVGFCLHVRRDCLAAIGGLSSIYRRGYFEDVELCLRARRAGWRNVCATSLYVVHHGTRSFKGDKRALVVRNYALFRGRYPEFEAEDEAYLAADPLRRAREALDREIPTRGLVRLIVADAWTGNVAERVHRFDRDTTVIVATWRRRGDRTTIDLHARTRDAVQLSFDLESEVDALVDHVSLLVPDRIEIGGRRPPPPELLTALRRTAAPMDVFLGDLPPETSAEGDVPPVVACFDAHHRALEGRWERLVVVESGTRAALKQHRPARADHFTGLPRDNARRSARPATATAKRRATSLKIATPPTGPLGVIVQTPSPGCDRFVRLLSDALRRRDPERTIVVLGRGVDDMTLLGLGNVVVTGTIAVADYPRALLRHGVSALVLPYSAGPSGLFERIATETSLPAALYDWSFGSDHGEASELFLDPRVDDRKTISQIIDWHFAGAAAP